jgi:hypothetical protein
MNNTKRSQRYDNKSINSNNSNKNSHYSINSNNINIDNIPYARSYQNMPQRNKNNNLNDSKFSLNGLPPIPKTPYQDEKYRQAYDNCNQAKGLIQTRLNKLIYEKKMLGEMKQNFNPYNADYESIYKLRTLGNAKGKLGNPHLYNNQFMDPIYYPLEMPICAEPVTLPKIEIGHPMNKQKCCNHGLGIEDLLALFSQLNVPEPPVIYQPPPQIPQIIPPYPAKRQKKKKKIEVKKKTDIPEKKPQPELPRKGLKRDWWKLCRDWVLVYTYFSTGRKYSDFAKVRNNLIANKTKALQQDLGVLKEWVISITQSFWDEFKVFTDLNVSFKNIDSKLKITRESQKIIAMIRKFLESLITNSTKLQDIPERVQLILYSYIKDKAYFPKNYLSTYQINRVDYYFYGSTKNVKPDQVGMLIAFLIISVVTVQQILLHMKENFVEFRNYPNIDITGKYVGSIMHYLVRDTFNNNPTMLKEILALMNFYRNYHIYNKAVESQDDIFNNNMAFKDEDEFADFLVPESSITEFWSLNAEFVQTFKNYVYSWATRLGKLIRLKYQKSDPNLAPRKRLERPQDKTATVKVERREWEEEYEEEEDSLDK